MTNSISSLPFQLLRQTKWSIQPSSILRWFAAMSAHLEPSRVETFLPHIITPIHRIIDDETIKNPQMGECFSFFFLLCSQAWSLKMQASIWLSLLLFPDRLVLYNLQRSWRLWQLKSKISFKKEWALPSSRQLIKSSGNVLKKSVEKERQTDWCKVSRTQKLLLREKLTRTMLSMLVGRGRTVVLRE